MSIFFFYTEFCEKGVYLVWFWYLNVYKSQKERIIVFIVFVN